MGPRGQRKETLQLVESNLEKGGKSHQVPRSNAMGQYLERLMGIMGGEVYIRGEREEREEGERAERKDGKKKGKQGRERGEGRKGNREDRKRGENRERETGEQEER